MLNVGFANLGPEGVYGFQFQILMAHRLRMRSQSEMTLASFSRLAFSGRLGHGPPEAQVYGPILDSHSRFT